MKFMCLVLLDSEVTKTMTDADWQALGAASLDYDTYLFRDGSLIMAQALQGPDTARTVRVRKGEAVVSDGPYIETREQVAGFVLVEARDMDHAIEIAKGIPIAKIGAVEIRPEYLIPRP
ncbi:YciI family protein [Pelagibacterium limicola]|uniref:YciI family protein n=1 Tax=Pelagibacterium limicola TaxID=2791022 RepID=UPI0018AFE3D5|nr:YciI family protein [Pelagibacterium limicola]